MKRKINSLPLTTTRSLIRLNRNSSPPIRNWRWYDDGDAFPTILADPIRDSVHRFGEGNDDFAFFRKNQSPIWNDDSSFSGVNPRFQVNLPSHSSIPDPYLIYLGSQLMLVSWASLSFFQFDIPHQTTLFIKLISFTYILLLPTFNSFGYIAENFWISVNESFSSCFVLLSLCTVSGSKKRQLVALCTPNVW